MVGTVLPLTGALTVGQVVKFKGYTDLDGIEPILSPGQMVRIESIDDANGALTVLPVEGGDGDTVFLDEVTADAVALGMVPTTPGKVAAASTKLPRKSGKVETKAKPKGKAVAKPSKAAIKAKPKGKTKASSKKVEPVVEPKAESKAKVRAAKQAAPRKTRSDKGTKVAVQTDAFEETRPGTDMLDLLDASDDALLQTEVPVEVISAKTAEVPVQPGTAVATLSSVQTEGGRVVDSDRVSELLAQQDALDAAKALVAQAEETYFTLGGVLSHIYWEGIYKSLGYDGKRGFVDYIDRELGIHYRKAMYLIDIYTKFRAIGIDERRLTQIGWSKAKEIKDYATADNFDELIDLASSKSREELVSHLRETFVGGEQAERVRKIKINLSLFADQAETVNRAIDAAKERIGNDDLSQAMEYICAEWLSLTEGIEVPLEDMIRHVELKYGVRLVPQSAAEATEVAVEA